MYLVCLPRIAADLNASEVQLDIVFLRISGGHGSCDVICR